MFDLPDQYRVDVKINIKDFVPKNLKPQIKKRLKQAIKTVKLSYQIIGEEIPSVINEEYRCQVIQMYDIEVNDVKEAAFISTTYQKIIKSLCILRIHDSGKEVYSFALKRLSHTEDNEIVVYDNNYTEEFHIILPDAKRDRFFKIMSFNHIINKTNKLNYYFEMYVKEYMVQNEKKYANMDELLSKPIWYDNKKTMDIYLLIKSIVNNKEQAISENNNAERVKINQEIKKMLERLEAI